MTTARPPGGGSPNRGWRIDVCGSSAYTDGDDVGKGAGAGGKEASREQADCADGPGRRLQERAEPGEGERLAVALRVHVMCPSHVRGCALLAAPPPAVLSPRRLDGRWV